MIRSLQATRRRFFGLAPGGVLAAKTAAEQTMLRVAGQFEAPVGHSAVREVLRGSSANQASAQMPYTKPHNVDWFDWRRMREDAIMQALNTPAKRAELESLVYERYRHISFLHADIAVHRSFSAAAKLCYQRQRLVDVPRLGALGGGLGELPSVEESVVL